MKSPTHTLLLFTVGLALVLGDVNTAVGGKTNAQKHAAAEAYPTTMDDELQASSAVGRLKPEFQRLLRCHAYEKYFETFLPAVIATDQCAACMSCGDDHSSWLDLCPTRNEDGSCGDIDEFCRDIARPHRPTYRYRYSSSESGKSSSNSGKGGLDDACEGVCPATCQLSCVKYVRSCCPCGQTAGKFLVDFDADKQASPIDQGDLFLVENDLLLNENSPFLSPPGMGDISYSGQPIYMSFYAEESATLGYGDPPRPFTGDYGLYMDVPSSQNATSLFLWKSEDFFSSSCASEVKTASWNSGTAFVFGSEFNVRIVIKFGDNWYVGQSTVPFGNEVPLSSIVWKRYNPYDVDPSSTAGFGDPLNFTEFTCVEFIGLQFDAKMKTGSATGIFRSFQALS